MISKMTGATEMAKILLTTKLKVVNRGEVKMNKSRNRENKIRIMLVEIAGINLLHRKIHNIDISP